MLSSVIHTFMAFSPLAKTPFFLTVTINRISAGGITANAKFVVNGILYTELSLQVAKMWITVQIDRDYCANRHFFCFYPFKVPFL